MDKCENLYCPDCHHHLYQNGTMFWCQECGGEVQPRDVATYHEIEFLRAKYDAQAAKAEREA